MTDGWDRSTLVSRISDAAGQQRFAAGSPDAAEVGEYRNRLLANTSMRTVTPPRTMVLGMTPELRNMALLISSAVVSVDRSAESITLYRDWVPPALARRERIVHGEWSDELRRLEGRLDAILGDGVFGNVAPDAHSALLDAAAGALAESGVLILRHAMIPDGFDLARHRAEVQIARFRERTLSAAAFGLGMRLWGSFEQAYDAQTRLLDNRAVYERYDAWVERGLLTEEERALVRRYYFGGRTTLLRQSEWEALLARAGFSPRRRTLSGEDWYQYYPLYVCRQALDRQGTRRASAKVSTPRREVHICLLEQPDTVTGFAALMAYWINERCRRCSATVNDGIEEADVAWVFSQDPLGDPRRRQLLALLERKRHGARVMNHPDHYDAYHRPDCFERLLATGVRVPRIEFTEADRGRTPVVYKRIGEQMSEKVLEPFDGPRAAYRSFEFVDSRNREGMYRRFRAFYVAGAVRPSKAMTCREWNVCLKNDPTIVPSFDLTPDEIEQVRLIAKALHLDFFAVDFLRRWDDDAAFFLDINIYPRINSLLKTPPRYGLDGTFHTFDTRPRMGLPEPGGHPFPEVFDDALATFAAGRLYPADAGLLNALVQASSG